MATMMIIARDEKGVLRKDYWCSRSMFSVRAGEATSVLASVALAQSKEMHKVVFEIEDWIANPVNIMPPIWVVNTRLNCMISCTLMLVSF